jgi:heme oxygenase
MDRTMAQATSPTHLEIADLQAVMQLIEDRLDDIIAQMPADQRMLVPNALLNLAIGQILVVEGASVSAGILQRLADLIQNGEQPRGAGAFRLTGHDA